VRGLGLLQPDVASLHAPSDAGSDPAAFSSAVFCTIAFADRPHRYGETVQQAYDNTNGEANSIICYTSDECPNCDAHFAAFRIANFETHFSADLVADSKANLEAHFITISHINHEA
jgi:hypothetical protein